MAEKITRQDELTGVASLISLNIRRFESELIAGYEMILAAGKNQERQGTDMPFEGWAFKLVDSVFSDMLEAKVNHQSAEAYTEEVARRLRMKIKWAVRDAKKHR